IIVKEKYKRGVTFMKVELYEATDENPNLKDYDETVKNFEWNEVEKNFSWYETGKYNMANEAVDKHVENGLADNVALHDNKRDKHSSLTFDEMGKACNKAAHSVKDEA